MRKAITLCAALMLTAGAAAQEARKVWDFTKELSDETSTNMSIDVKSGSGQWTDMTSQGYYEMKARSEQGELYCLLNGNKWIIPETSGLNVGATAAKHIGIALPEHERGAHLWLNGMTEEDCITIPQVPAGDSITIVYEPAVLDDARGLMVTTSGVDSIGTSSATIFTSTTRDTIVIENNNSETTDVQLRTYPRGCRIFYICVGKKPDQPQEPEKDKIAYIYDSAFEGYDINSDMTNMVLTSMLPMRMENAEIVGIDISRDTDALTRDSLEKFNVVVIGDAVRTDNPFVMNLKDAICYVPVLNMGTRLYEAWGYGKPQYTQTNTIDIPFDARESILFKPSNESTAPYIDENGQLKMYESGSITGYRADPDSYFAADDTLATADGVGVIHMHSAERNAYMLLPYPAGVTPAESFGDIVTNAVIILNSTKRDVVKAPAPVINEEYHHQETTVSFCSAVDRCIYYYTTDGSEPTTSSTLYTGPFTVDKGNVTVKAIATAEGFLDSDAAEKMIVLHELVQTPAVSYTQENGLTTVTITPADHDDEVYYNYVGSGKTEESALYTTPIPVTRHTTITVFTAAKGELLQSEKGMTDIPVKGETVRIDVVSHMDANKAEWVPVEIGSKRNYYYAEGYNFYSDELTGQEPGKTPDGRDTVYNVYADLDSLVCYNPGNGWEMKTYGEGIVWEINEKTYEISDGSKTGPETPEDASEEMTGCCLSFVRLMTDKDGRTNPPSASIQSTEAFQGPFDVVTYVGSKIEGSATADIYVTTDTLDSGSWTKLGSVITGMAKRQWKKNILSYEGDEKVFVKLQSTGEFMDIYDIIIKNAGEKSEAYTGIEEASHDDSTSGQLIRTETYSINGTRLTKAAKGVNIIKEVYSNGRVKTRKAVVK